jgi:hypothetical protein
MKKVHLPQTKLKRVTTDGAPSTIGKKLGLLGRMAKNEQTKS